MTKSGSENSAKPPQIEDAAIKTEAIKAEAIDLSVKPPQGEVQSVKPPQRIDMSVKPPQ